MDAAPAAARSTRVRNKAPAAVQVTAEQLLRDANDFKEDRLAIPKQEVRDADELRSYQRTRRLAFETQTRRSRSVASAWCRYARWEEDQGELDRARSVFERALDVDHRNPVLWLHYAEMEARCRNVNRARNVYHRAVTLLPRVDTLWYRYCFLEEALGNVAGCRAIFERWIATTPKEAAWMAFVKFELRTQNTDAAHDVYKRFVTKNPSPANWIKWARFEETDRHDPDTARRVYQELLSTFDNDDKAQPELDEQTVLDQNVFISFAKFETRQQKYDDARKIYLYALDRLRQLGQPIEHLNNEYTLFTKQFGDSSMVGHVVLNKRRAHYEAELDANPTNYDYWIEYIDCECHNVKDAISSLNSTNSQLPIAELMKIDKPLATLVDIVCKIFERAVSNIPKVDDSSALLTETNSQHPNTNTNKDDWRRYIYIWIKYATFVELILNDMDLATSVYKRCLKTIPNPVFTFAKIWILYAKLLIRQRQLVAFRRTMFTACKQYGKPKLFKAFIDLELRLHEYDRVRNLYQEFAMFAPQRTSTWIEFARLELKLGDVERARGIFEIAATQPSLDDSDSLWDAYISAEKSLAEWERARGLLQRLLQARGWESASVWKKLAFLEIEAAQGSGNSKRESSITDARKVFEAGSRFFRDHYLACSRSKEDDSIAVLQPLIREQRIEHLKGWLTFERTHGDKNSIINCEKIQPREVHKKRRVMVEDSKNSAKGAWVWQESTTIVFPEDGDAETTGTENKLLEMARKWKEDDGSSPSDDGSSSDSDSSSSSLDSESSSLSDTSSEDSKSSNADSSPEDD